MNAYDLGNLSYLVLLGAALVFGMFVVNRGNLGRKLRDLATWAVIFLIVAGAVGLWTDIRGSQIPSQTVFEEAGRIELPRAQDGHYYAMLDLNGTPVRFMVDTGATDMVLTKQDAARMGVDLEKLVYMGEANTANGIVRTAPITLQDVAIGPFHDRNVRALVNGGEMEKSLLGMGYLNRFDRIEISGGKLVLER
jgi:aspartyl protease family protein